MPYMKLESITDNNRKYNNLAVNLTNGKIRSFFNVDLKVRKVEAELTLSHLNDAVNPCINCITKECGLLDGHECSRFWDYYHKK